MNRSLAACLALSCSSVAVPSVCFAGPNGGARLVVRADDLDLSTPEGVQALMRRIARAADQICTDFARGAREAAVDLPCRDDARAAAQAQVPQAIAAQHFHRWTAVAVTDPR
jgi:UrcA family protein